MQIDFAVDDDLHVFSGWWVFGWNHALSSLIQLILVI